MTGPYDSRDRGREGERDLQRFTTGMPSRFETAKGDPRFAAAVITWTRTADGRTGIDRMLLSEEDLKTY